MVESKIIQQPEEKSGTLIFVISDIYLGVLQNMGWDEERHGLHCACFSQCYCPKWHFSAVTAA
jgi:hypothetical protein